MKDSILNKNNKGERHGYQEWYNLDNKLYIRGNWKNGKINQYVEYHGFEKTLYSIL